MPKKENSELYNFTDLNISKMSITAKFNLPNGLEEVDFMADMKIDQGNLNAEIVEQASKYVWYATLASLAENMWEESKLNLEVTVAVLDKAIRQKALDDKVKLTESQIDNMMKGMKEWQEAKKTVLDWKKQTNIMNNIVQGWEHRKSMLVSLSLIAKRGLEDDIEIMKNKID